MIVSTIILWVCSLVAVLKPDQSLSDLDRNLPRDFIIGISAIFLCKCLSLAYMMFGARDPVTYDRTMSIQLQMQTMKKHSTFSELASTAERNLEDDTSVGAKGMHITRNPLHSVSEEGSPINGLPARLAAHSRAAESRDRVLSVQSRAAPSSPTVRRNPLA